MDSDGDHEFHTDEDESGEDAYSLKEVAATPLSKPPLPTAVKKTPPGPPPKASPGGSQKPLVKAPVPQSPGKTPVKAGGKAALPVLPSSSDEDDDSSDSTAQLSPLRASSSAANNEGGDKNSTAVFRGGSPLMALPVSAGTPPVAPKPRREEQAKPDGTPSGGCAASAASAAESSGSESDDEAPEPKKHMPEPSASPLRSPPSVQRGLPAPGILSPHEVASRGDFPGLLQRFFFSASGGESRVRVNTLLISLKNDADMRALRDQEYLSREEAAFLVFLSHLRAGDPTPMTWGEFKAMEPRDYESDGDTSTTSSSSGSDRRTPRRAPLVSALRPQQQTPRSRAGQHRTPTPTRPGAPGAAMGSAGGMRRSGSAPTRAPAGGQRGSSAGSHARPREHPLSQRGGGVTGSARAAQLEARRRASKVMTMKARRTAPSRSPKLHYLAHTRVLGGHASQPLPPAEEAHTASPSPVDLSALRPLRTEELPTSRRAPLISPPPDHEGATDSYISLLRERLGTPPRAGSPSPVLPQTSPLQPAAAESTEVLCLQTFIAQQREIIKGLEGRLRDAEVEAREARRKEHKARRRERRAQEGQRDIEMKLLQMSQPEKLRKLLRKHEDANGTPAATRLVSRSATATPMAASRSPQRSSPLKAATPTRRMSHSVVTQTTPPSSPLDAIKRKLQDGEVSPRQQEPSPAAEEGGVALREEVLAAQEKVKHAEGRLGEALSMLEEADTAKEVAEKKAQEYRKRAKDAEGTSEQLSKEVERLQTHRRDAQARKEADMNTLNEELLAAQDQAAKARDEVTRYQRVLALVEKKYKNISKAVCVRCGTFSSNMQLRNAGLKCSKCVGKKSGGESKKKRPSSGRDASASASRSEPG